MVGIWQLLNKLEALEEKLEDLYRFFSVTFIEEPETSAVFQKLSREEKSHQNLIQFQQRMVMKNQKAFKDVPVDLSDIDAALEKIVHARNSNLDIHEAVAFAIEVETSAAENHYRTAMDLSNPEISQLLTKLNQADNNHVAFLKKFAARTKHE